MSIISKTRAGIDKTFNCLPEICIPYGYFTGERVVTPKGLAFVIGVCENDLYFIIDGDRGCSKWSNYKKNDFIEKNFKLVYSLRDFHLNKSDVADEYKNSIYSIANYSHDFGCCCCFGCISKVCELNHEESAREGVFINNIEIDNRENNLEISQTIYNDLDRKNENISNCNHHATHYLAPALKFLMNNKTYSDINLIVFNDKDNNNKVKIPVNRGILAARLNYFDILFSGKMSESISQLKEIELPDMSYSVTQVILEYLYTGCCNIPNELITNVAIASDKLLLHDLKEKCCNLMISKLSDHCVFEMLQIATILNMNSLKNNSIDYIINNFENPKISGSFKKYVSSKILDAEIICEIIRRQNESYNPNKRLRSNSALLQLAPYQQIDINQNNLPTFITASQLFRAVENDD